MVDETAGLPSLRNHWADLHNLRCSLSQDHVNGGSVAGLTQGTNWQNDQPVINSYSGA